MNRLLLSVLLAALVAPTDSSASPPPGKPLFANQCAPCHGAKGTGDTPLGRKWHLADLTSPAWQSSHSDDAIRAVIREGKAGTRMRPYASKLTPVELDAIVAFIRSLKR